MLCKSRILQGMARFRSFMGSNTFTDTIASCLETALLAHGFQCHGTTFVADRKEVNFLIWLDKQSSTRKNRLVFSLYVCVYSKDLARHFAEQAGRIYSSEPRKLRWYNCHWKRNIAYALSNDQGMMFWQVESEQEALKAGKEIVRLLQDWGLPYLENLSSTANLAAYWRSGGGEGINEPSRSNCLKILDDLLLERMIGL
jgi:hypothetical protein